MIHLENLVTEAMNPKSKDLDCLSVLEILQVMNEEDRQVAQAIKDQLPEIGKVVEAVAKSFRNGGKLFLCGAGTSGRIAVSEASECPPTFSTPPEMVQAVMAGAPESIFRAVEGAEDHAENGENDLRNRGIISGDVLIGVSASGRTPYVCGAIAHANKVGATTALICSNRPEETEAQFVIAPATGPEVLTGSTRLKAASAAKMVLNMITTASMVCLGKVYSNLMVDVNPNSEKLIDRASRIVVEITGCPKERAVELVTEAKNAKVAVVMHLKNVDREKAIAWLGKKQGNLRAILEDRS